MPSVPDDIAVARRRWFDLDVPAPGDWTPSLADSVVIPYFEAPEALRLTLAALGEQTYPDSLVEVIVVDDGSELPLAPIDPIGSLRTRVVRQEDLGFGLARARNNGAAQASGEILVFLDCDMVPEPTWLEAHARWHHLVPDAVTLGFRRHVDFDGISPDDIAAAARSGDVGDLFVERKQEEPEWIEFHMSRTAGLTSNDDDLFRVVTGGNLAMRAEAFHAVGGFDESFTQWGAEDTELGYRLFTFGAELIPERGALCWHQGLGNVPDPAEKISLDEQRAKISHLIADPTLRRWMPGRSYLVPYAAVRIDAEGSRGDVERCVESVLANRFHDLVVLLRVPDSFPDAEALRRTFDGDPRVLVNDNTRARFAAVNIDIPASAQLSDRSIGRIVQLLRGVGELRVGAAGGATIVARKQRVDRFAQRRGDDALASLFGIATASARDVGVQWTSASRRRFLGRFQENSAVGKAARRLRQVRSWNDVGALMRWLMAGVRHRVTSRRFDPATRSLLNESKPSVAAAQEGWVDGYRVLASDRALLPGAGLFDGRDLPEGRLDLLVTDGELPKGTELEILARGGVVCSSLNIVAFDWRGMPDQRFVNEPVNRAAAKPGTDAAAEAWLAELDIEVDRRDALVPGADGGPTHLFLADHPDLHESRSIRAAYLVEAAARGYPIVADRVRDLDGLLDQQLIKAMEDVVPGRMVDANYRELIAVNLRRAAVVNHSSAAVVRRLLQESGRTSLDPSVSVVLATNRREFLTHALAEALAQNYENLQVVVALHGDLGHEAAVEAESLGCTIVQSAAETPFGEVLNQACAVADGDLIAKMDDDDWYGPHHISDLVLARAHSGAQLVGKGAEFVYLASSEKTIRRFVGGAGSRSRTLAGGCLLISRADLREVGGWRVVDRSIDKALIEDVIRAGGAVYRTHGFEYILNRHGHGHTWDTADRYFADQAEFSWDGLQLEVAGIYSAG